MALSVKQLQDKKARLVKTMETLGDKAISLENEITEVDELLQAKTAELQAQIDEINGTQTNTTEEVI